MIKLDYYKKVFLLTTVLISSVIFSQEKNFSCIDAVFNIISSSKSYHDATDGLAERVIKNGGQGMGWIVYESPNPKRDDAFIGKSKDYVIVLHETYSDHNVNFKTYTFRPANLHLYESDDLNGGLIKCNSHDFI